MWLIFVTESFGIWMPCEETAREAGDSFPWHAETRGEGLGRWKIKAVLSVLKKKKSLAYFFSFLLNSFVIIYNAACMYLFVHFFGGSGGCQLSSEASVSKVTGQFTAKSTPNPQQNCYKYF